MSAQILMYHALQASPSVIACSPRRFAEQMRWLHEQRCHVVSLGDMVHTLREAKPLPPHAVAITFDDGFESVYTEAFPVLVRYGFPATVFAVTGYTGQRNDWDAQPTNIPRYPLLTWAQIREMDTHHIEIGAHGVRHRRLDHLERRDMESELRDAQNALTDQLGHPVDLLAYPYGRYNKGVTTAAATIYRAACAAHPDVVTARSDPFALPRVEAGYVSARALFHWFMRPGYRLYLRLRGALRTVAAALLRRPWH